MIKHIFQSSENGLWYDGNNFNVTKDKAVRYPSSVNPIYFRFNHGNLLVIREEVKENDDISNHLLSSSND